MDLSLDSERNIWCAAQFVPHEEMAVCVWMSLIGVIFLKCCDKGKTFSGCEK